MWGSGGGSEIDGSLGREDVGVRWSGGGGKGLDAGSGSM